MTEKTKNVAIGVIIIIVLFFAYKFLVTKKETKPAVSETAPTASSEVNFRKSAPSVFNGTNITLKRIKNIRVDPGVFSGEVFRSLNDFRTEIPPEPVGRYNPFAPIN